MDETTKEFPKTKKIVIAAVIAAVLLIPLPMFIKDGGTVNYQGIFYSVTKHHRIYTEQIEDVPYSYYPEQQVRYLVGTTVKFLGVTVFDDTHVEPEGSAPHADELLELVKYYNDHAIEGLSFNSINVIEAEPPYQAGLYFFTANQSLVDSNELYLLIALFLEEHPDHFLNEGYRLEVHYWSRRDEGAGVTNFSTSYFIDTPDTATIDIDTDPYMVPDTMPSYDSFVDARSVTFIGENSTDEQIDMLRRIYPGAEIITE